jgi:hypothetical protein
MPRAHVVVPVNESSVDRLQPADLNAPRASARDSGTVGGWMGAGLPVGGGGLAHQVRATSWKLVLG